MRIASLVPSATETLFALGLGPDVVGVTHECDYPAEASELPHLTRTVIPEGLSTAETAECLDLTLDVVKTRLHRAREVLRKNLYRRAGVTFETAFDVIMPKGPLEALWGY